MSFSFKLRSHIKPGQPFESGQLLVDHLKGVRDIALDTHGNHGMTDELDDIINTICLCHDFGKSSMYFQDYLKGNKAGKLKNHGEISAYFTYYMLPEKWKLVGFMCVKKHHGNMSPDINFFHCEDKEMLLKIADSIEKNIHELNQIYGQDIFGFFESMKNGSLFKSVSKSFRMKCGKFLLEDLVNTQYLWSLLLTGDKSQLIRKDGKAYKSSIVINEDLMINYRKKLINEVLKKNPGIENTVLFKIRNQAYDDIQQAIDKIDLNKEHIFTINLPTGTGKTLCVYGAAFKLFKRLFAESNMRIRPSIIYCLPFTSVIDQNHDVLEKIMAENNIDLSEDFILKHHSMTPIEYHSSIGEEETEYRNYDARFCVENWQSTVITTTFVQLFTTIFKVGINSIGNRFHKLAGSIIILDEVQAIPPKYYRIIEEFFQFLCNRFNAYVITVTATKPLFLRGVELIGNKDSIFKELNRIVIENHTDVDKGLNEFCSIVKEDIAANPHKSFLIVLNTVKSALKTAEALKGSDRKLVYLSTEIYPQRRLEIIDEIKENPDDKYVLVSTQLIEAGVDVDFDIVYRDFSTMDSINQTAGRANRNAVKGKGIVKLYRLLDEDNMPWRYSAYIYSKSLLAATENILKSKSVIEECDILNINQEYFEAVDNIKSDDDYKDIKRSIGDIDFRKISNLFELIDKDYRKEDIIININDETQYYLDVIENEKSEYQEVLNAWRILNRYKISVDKKYMKDIACSKIKGDVNVLDKSKYDIDWGIKKSNCMMC